VHDGSDVDPTSEDNVLEDSPRKEQIVEGLISTNKHVKDIGIRKHLEVENIATTVEDISDKPTEIEDVVALEYTDVKHVEPTSEASIMVTSQPLLCAINVEHTRKATNSIDTPI
jgi:hypothetical protein